MPDLCHIMCILTTLEFLNITLNFIYTDNECKWQILLLVYPYTSPALELYIYIYIYTELAPKLPAATASVAQWWSTGLVIQRTRVRFPAARLWSCIFRNWSRFGSYNVYLNDTRIHKHNFEFHLLTTSVNAKYYNCYFTIYLLLKRRYY